MCANQEQGPHPTTTESLKFPQQLLWKTKARITQEQMGQEDEASDKGLPILHHQSPVSSLYPPWSSDKDSEGTQYSCGCGLRLQAAWGIESRGTLLGGPPSECLPVCPLGFACQQGTEARIQRAPWSLGQGLQRLQWPCKWRNIQTGGQTRLPRRPPPSSLIGPVQVVLEDSQSKKARDCLGPLAGIRKHSEGQSPRGWDLCGLQPIAGQALC